RDRPRISDDLVVVLEDRDLALAAEGDRGLVADRDRMDREGEALVMQGKPGAPGERAEPAIVAAAKLPQLEHLHLRKVQSILRRTFNESRWCRNPLQFNCDERRARRDDFSSNRHPAPASWWRMIFSENRYPLFGIMR